MYALLSINVLFLAAAIYHDVPPLYSLGFPAVLLLAIALRSIMWLLRRQDTATAPRIRRYLFGTLAAAVVLGVAFGAWGLLLLQMIEPARFTAVVLYLFVSSITCCYCLQALPAAGWAVLAFGTMPATFVLIFSGHPYDAGVGIPLVLAAALILWTLAHNRGAFDELLRSRAEMRNLVGALGDSQEHYRQSVALNPQIPWIADRTGSTIELSPRWSTLTGLSVEEGLGWQGAAALHPDDLPQVRERWQRALSGEEDHLDARYRLRHADGTYRWMRTRSFPRRDENGEVLAWYGTLEDIHDQMLAEQALQQSEERYRLASLATNDVIWDLRMDGSNVEWSSAVATVLGYPEALAGTSRDWWVERIHPEDRPHVLERFRDVETDASLRHWSLAFRFLAGSGTYLHLNARGYVVRDPSGRATRLIGALQDVTKQVLFERSLRRAAHYDALTGLPNRTLFAERLDAVLAQAHDEGKGVALAILDLDRFKMINDNLGHDAGDAMLSQLAVRLSQIIPPEGTVARLGGDEFAAILPGFDAETDPVGAVDALLSTARAPVSYKGRQLDLGFSVGVAVAFGHGEAPRDVHKRADLALYAAKKEGGGRIRCYRAELGFEAEREIQMLYDAREALRHDRIVPFYQPKISFHTGECVGFEALLRWHHEQVFRTPDEIAAALSDPGTSTQITDRILDKVIGDILAWEAEGLRFGRVAVNSSTHDFSRGDFAERILTRLERAGVAAHRIELEVTESVLTEQLSTSVESTLRTLSDAGVTIALDDFGTGYASLTHLKQFPVDVLKIDRSFIEQIDLRESEDAMIVRTILDLAKRLGILTVAEGIETASQARALAQWDCDVAQGYLFGRPTDAEAATRLLQNWNAAAALETFRGGV
ncbi:putative bifunctional diguanylate cyclase/phosphodiesterase [Novosphingobium panipatense]|nr:EAL domain-containing protein [Novosphingobium panipatense]